MVLTCADAAEVTTRQSRAGRRRMMKSAVTECEAETTGLYRRLAYEGLLQGDKRKLKSC